MKSLVTTYFLMKSVTMQFNISPMLGSVCCLMMLQFLIATLVITSLADKVQEKAGGNLKDDDGGSVNSDALVSDLQNKKRVIFAVGPVNSKITLFISGPGGKTDFASGCTVEVEDSNAGVFKITNPPGKMPTGISSADVIFVCVDSPGSKLVTMSSSSVSTVKLPDGGSESTKITVDDNIHDCFKKGSIHLTSSESLHYYTVSTSGEVQKYHFNAENIKSSDACSADEVSSKLCISGDKLTIKKDCTGSNIPGLVSGYVSASIAYLFDTDNNVYIFDSSAFTSKQTVLLKKVTNKEAWKSSVNVHPSSNKPEPKGETTNATTNSTFIFAVLGILALLLIFLCIFVYCCFFRGNGKNTKKKEGGAAASGKKEKGKKSSKKTGGSKKKSTISKDSSFSADKKGLSKGSPSKKKGSKNSKGNGSLA